SLGQSIAKLNAQITQAMGSSGTPNELLDQRDATIQKLAKLVGVQVTQQNNGTVNVALGKGQPLVVGAQAIKLKIASSPFDSSRSEIALATTGQVISGQLSGGDVGGLLSVRDSVVVPALNQLGRLAAALAISVNAQNQKGMDLNGQLGGKLLSIGGPVVLPAGANTGTATLSARISNVSQLSASDYTLSRTASGWTLTASDGSNVLMSGAGTTTSPFTAAGLSLVVSGTVQTGDRYQIQPTRSLAQGLGRVSNDPTRIAAAVPVRSAAAPANTGKASIGTPSVTHGSNLNLLNPVSIQFITPTAYQINGAGSYAYTSGTPIAINGWQVAISGTPAIGDQFTVQANTGGVGDNGNALKLAGLAAVNLLDGGTTTLGGAYGQLVAGTGTLTAQSQTQLDTATAVANQAQAAQQSVAGVNLNEEAAKLLRFQQSFQAAAHVISTAQTLFQTLLQAVR
ncbi:MAG TPA: flagellar hook-associated protein FlgK, partial [Mizugakiibacter sp.]|nr:flagellar hook-associated protein FlgK [Mizugakiibacter sp.]